MVILQLLPSGLSEMFAQISLTGKLTLADRYGILAAILNTETSEDELYMLDRLLHAIRRGRVQIVDELSSVL